jgi:hypothetical protein
LKLPPSAIEIREFDAILQYIAPKENRKNGAIQFGNKSCH